MSEKLLTIREAAYTLGISEKEVIEFAEQGIIPAYKVGGLYLRFQKEQIEQYKSRIKTTATKISRRGNFTASERVRDFFYFYDFYILSCLLIGILLFIIIKG